jgi:AcrR family transcriptional regulator
MPRPADPTARDRILRTASRLFYERGIRPVGLAEVIEEAGTGKNVLYRHFPGKEELVLAYLEDFAERLDASTDEALAGLAGGAGLVALAEQVAERVSHRGYRGCPFRNYLREMRDTRDRPGRFALAQVRALRSRIEHLVADLDVDDPDALVGRIWLTLEGAYAAAPYPERKRLASSAVAYVEDLVA